MEQQDGPDDLQYDFAALLIHDLETPIAVAKQFLKRVEQGRHNPENPSHQRLLVSTQVAMKRAERILEDMLDQARYSATGLRIRRTLTNLRRVALDCIDLVAHIADDRGIVLETDFQPMLSDALMLDTRLIERVIDNFLVNAIRHAPRDTKVLLRTRHSAESVRVEVANAVENGFETDLEDIFNPVRQVQLRKERKLQGSGLGLTFSRMVVDAHGGRVGAGFERGEEVVFWFEVPA